MSADSRSSLRQSLRQKRRQLSAEQQALAASLLDQQLSHSGILGSNHIAFYMASDGEIDPGQFLSRALGMGKICYLPVVGAEQALHFVRFREGDQLSTNRFGIPEPDVNGDAIAVVDLDVILLPLVGFDRRGSRLGMGGGFYDRSLAGLSRDGDKQRPQLIGLAHSCQEVDSINTESWDVPLEGIVTEREVIRVRPE